MLFYRRINRHCSESLRSLGVTGVPWPFPLVDRFFAPNLRLPSYLRVQAVMGFPGCAIFKISRCMNRIAFHYLCCVLDDGSEVGVVSSSTSVALADFKTYNDAFNKNSL